MVLQYQNMNEQGNAVIYAILSLFVVILIAYFAIAKIFPALENAINVNIPFSIIIPFFLLIFAAMLVVIKTLIE